MLHGDSGHGVVRPGPVVRLTGAVSGDGLDPVASAPDGWFAFTTVEVEELSVLQYLLSRVSGDDAVVSLSSANRSSVAKAQMLDSKHTALRLALLETRAAEVPSNGSLVLDVLPGSPAAEASLLPLDVITAVDGSPVLDPVALRTAIGSGSGPLTVSYLRGTSRRTAEIQPRDGVIGVQVAPSYADALAGTIEVDTGSVGGPSAGLMLTLAAIDSLSPGDLTAGFRVAGTGTISPDGNVGPISGITYKLEAANAAGAQWFILPAAQLEEVENLPQAANLRLVPVESLKEAVAALCESGASDAYCDR